MREEVNIVSGATVGGVAAIVGVTAAIDANGWVMIIGAIFLGIIQVLTTIFNRQKISEVKKEVVGVKEEITEVKDSVVKVEEKVEIVHKATNSMKDALVDVTRLAAMSEGELKGRAAQKTEDKLDVQISKDLKAEEKKVEKQDAKELREETKEISGKLENVKVTGEDTNSIVKKEAKEGKP